MSSELLSPALGIVDQIVAAQGTERRQFLCQAEFADLSENQAERLMPILWRYAVENRDSDDPADIVAVGSAIRQYVARLDVARVDDIGILLESGHQNDVPLPVELEIAKMVFRKFDANPPAQRDLHTDLSKLFVELILAYVNPRILSREQYAAVTMLAVQALVAMRSSLTQKIIGSLNQSSPLWFRQQLHRRMSQLADSWAERGLPQDTVRELSSFCDEICLGQTH